MAAKSVVGILKSSEEKKIESFRVKAIATKKKEEIVPMLLQIEADKKRVSELEDELNELSVALAKANNMLDFLKETFEVSKSKEKKLDYYERLEKTMEQKKEFLQVCRCFMITIISFHHHFAYVYYLMF
jgi:hypothetical protein